MERLQRPHSEILPKLPDIEWEEKMVRFVECLAVMWREMEFLTDAKRWCMRCWIIEGKRMALSISHRQVYLQQGVFKALWLHSIGRRVS
jgi:hypothetical protein